jgi:hypothetical protein
MKGLYVVGGIVSLGIGVYIVFTHGRKFLKGEFQDQGYDIKMFFTGIGAIILGIGLIINYI